LKLVTHNIFSIGLMLFVVSLFGRPLLVTVFLAVVATLLTNLVIDKVGHAGGVGVARRTWLTHSIITAPFWGAAVWALTLVIPAALVGVFPPDPVLLHWFASLGVVAAWSHLLLDWVTEGGVFAFDGRRRALAHFSYDNLPLNLGFSALGVALLLAAIL
jgi:Protein of unknown function (DUF1286)